MVQRTGRYMGINSIFEESKLKSPVTIQVNGILQTRQHNSWNSGVSMMPEGVGANVRACKSVISLSCSGAMCY